MRALAVCAALGVCVALPVAAQAAADTTVTIRATGSELVFRPPRISVKQGTRLTVVFINDGTLPHNVVVPRLVDDIDALARAAYDAAETGYVPLQEKEKLLAYSVLASPGDTVEVSLVVPSPGEYTYACLVPGHTNSMFGTLRSLR